MPVCECFDTQWHVPVPDLKHKKYVVNIITLHVVPILLLARSGVCSSVQPVTNYSILG